MKPKGYSPARRLSILLALATSLSAFAARLDAVTVLVDFGAPSTTSPTNGTFWNNIDDAVAGAVADAVDSATGAPTGIGIAISSRFNGVNTNGFTSSALYPASASGNSFFGNTVEFSGQTIPASQLVVSGLNPSFTYDFTFYASRMGVADNRETRYVVTGAGAPQTAFLDVANNSLDNTAMVAGIVPNGSNQITIDVSPGPNNTNSSGFFYLGVMELQGVPEPSAGTVLLLTLAGTLLVRRRA